MLFKALHNTIRIPLMNHKHNSKRQSLMLLLAVLFSAISPSILSPSISITSNVMKVSSCSRICYALRVHFAVPPARNPRL